tara:strand:- start:559 stop:774 length:216 start_codon:yes stop_codon:yes gene_type:complete
MSKDYEKQNYTVYITAHYKPISVMACSKEDAEKTVQEHHVWGEPSDIDILAVGKFEPSPVATQTRKQTNKW